MSGIFDRIGGDDNVAVHFITSAIVLGAAGEFTNQNILDAVNAQIDVPLDAASQTDLVNIKAETLAQSDAGDRGVYMHKLESILIAVEVGAFTNEANFRAFLNISG